VAEGPTEDNAPSRDEAVPRLGALNVRVVELYAHGLVEQALPIARDAVALARRALTADDPEVAPALNNLAELYRLTGDIAAAEPLYLEALEATRRRVGDRRPEFATCLANLAQLHVETGRYDEALLETLQALEIRQETLGPDHPLVVNTLRGASAIEEALGDYALAASHLESALEAERGASGGDTIETLASLGDVGALEYAAGDYERAQATLRRAVQGLEELAPDSAALAQVLENLAAVESKLANPQEAASLLERVVAIRGRAESDDPAAAVEALDELARIHRSLGEYDAATRNLEQAAELVERTGVEDELARRLNELGALYLGSGRYSDAELSLRRSLELIRKTRGERAFETATVIHNLAVLEHKLGRSDAAENLYSEALGIFRESRGDDDPSTATALLDMGELYAATGRVAAGISLLEQAVATRRRVFGEASPEVGDGLSRLGTAYAELGDHERADACVREALRIGVAAFGPVHPTVRAWRTRLAELVAGAGDTAGAEELLREQLDEARAHFAHTDPPVVAASDDLAAYLESTGGAAAALELRRETLEARCATLGARHLEVAESFERVAALHRLLGDAAEAVAGYEEALDIRRESRGPPEAYAATLVHLADLRLELGEKAAALTLYAQAISLYDLLGLDSVAVEAAETVLELRRGEDDAVAHATAANTVAEFLRNSGDLDRPESLYDEALAAVAAGPESAETEELRAIVTSNHGLLYADRGSQLEARRLFEEALAILRTQGARSAALAAVLNNLSQTYVELADFATAEPLLQESLEIRREVSGERSPEVAIALHQLGLLQINLGDFAGAKDRLTEALRVRIEAQGMQHPELAPTATALAYVHRRLGDLETADELLGFALAVQRAALEPDHPDIAFTLGGLGQIAQQRGDYATAEDRFGESGRILRARFGDDHPTVATNLNNLAGLLAETGDYDGAESNYREAREITRKAGNDADLATTLNNLGLLLWRGRGDLFGAVELLEEALDTRRRVLGDRHLDVAQSMNNLAAIAFWMDPDSAEALLQEALTIRRELLGDDHPEVAETLNNLAYQHQGRGEYEEAQDLFEEALAIRRKHDDEPNKAITLTNLGCVLSLRGEPQRALLVMSEAQTAHDRVIAKISGLASERQRLDYLEHVATDFHALLTLVVDALPDDPTAARTAFDILQRRKAIGSEALATQREAVLGGRYPSLAPRLTELAELRAEIAALTLDPDGVARGPATPAELNARREALERELARSIPEMRLAERLHAADRRAVAASLPDGAAIVEVVHYATFDPASLAPGATPEPERLRYAAFVLAAGRSEDIDVIDLGNADDLERRIAALRSVITGEPEVAPDGTTFRSPPSRRAAVALETRLGTELRRMLFDPLLPALGGRTRLFVAPDGDLARLPLEVLPTDDGRRLIDDYVITYVTAARDSVRFGTSARAVSEPLVVADPAFDLETNGPPNGKASVPAGRRWKELSGLTFDQLEGTRAEGERVAGLLGVEPLLGPAALEGRIKSCRSPRVLHLATHGFFLPDRERRPRDALAVGIPATAAPTAPVDNPMLRSGLALAGANTWLAGKPVPAEAEDGLLTAEDVTALDLLGTRLVVLSACETGLGTVRAGEGVFGLRRAFALAGAESLIMSLWKVPDDTTRELMEAFYRGILAGRRRDEALRAAQLSIRAKFPDTLSWGAFICQGDPGELDLDR
jgi:tetratricopeptide (TPR) repeat protein/CHAT domain-containing protein